MAAKPRYLSLGVTVLVLALACAAGMLWLNQGDPEEDSTSSQLMKLRSRDVSVRRTTASELGQVDPRDVSAVVGALTSCLDDEDAEVRAQVAHSLGTNLALNKTFPEAAAVEARLVQALKDQDRRVRGAAAYGLALVGHDAAVVLPGLIDALQSPDPITRGEADGALYSVRLTSEANLRFLIGLVRNENRTISGAVSNALTRADLGTEPGVAAPVFVNAAADKDPAVRTVAIKALGNVGKGMTTVRDVLIAAVKDEDPSARAASAASLVVFGADPSGRAALQAALEDEDLQVRSAAATSLDGSRGASKNETLAELAKTLKDQGQRTELADAIASGSSDSVPRLIDGLSDEDARVRRASASALGEIAPRTKLAATAINALIASLKDRDEDVQITVACALIRFDTAARTAIPALTEATKDQNRRVSAYASAALKVASKPPMR